MFKEKLNASDHQLLLLLIQGKTIREASIEMKMSKAAVNCKLIRIKQMLECFTTYQVIAIEMVNLLFKDESNEELISEPKFLTKANGM